MQQELQKQFFILIGRSGSGKGTQAALLQGALEDKGAAKVMHITTGGGFREFLQSGKYVANLSKDVNTAGGLQPEFLAVWNWSNILINTITGNETVILDGAPRKPFEASILHSAINFLGYHKPVVIYLDVSESKSREHIKGRGREDDKNENNVTSRMNWFETDVLPTLDIYMHDPRYAFLHIDGERPIEEVHKDIMEKINKVQ
jgi:adenylate kinase family enzyme